MFQGSIAALVLATLFSQGVAAAVAPADDSSPSAVDLSPVSHLPRAATEDVPDDCDQQPQQDKLPEKMRSRVHEFSCRSVRWIDSWFGDDKDFNEHALGGKFSLGMSWNEYENVEGRLRFRVRSDLPNFSSRWNAFFGRVEEDAYISDTETLQERASRQGIGAREDPEWLLGLGYKNRNAGQSGWDYSAGIRLRTPARIYTRARYRHNFQLSEHTDLRYRQTFFWRDGTGYGTTTHIDATRTLSDTDLLRWELVGLLAEDTEGTRWFAGNTWYHHLGNERGISLLSFVRGETDTEVPLHEYGFELTLRRQVARDWLFLNYGPTLTWPRLHLNEKREASLGFQVLMEFEFGAPRK